MSRIGKMPVVIPSGVEVKIDGTTVTVKGKKGELTRTFQPTMIIKQEGEELLITPADEERQTNAYWGLTRSLLSNMRSSSPVPRKSRWARWPLTSASGASRSPTRARASATRVSTYVARLARPARNKLRSLAISKGNRTCRNLFSSARRDLPAVIVAFVARSLAQQRVRVFA